MNITTVSWSQMLTYMTCGRKHELAYFENLERIPNAMNKARMYGTAFHAAMAENLRLWGEPINKRIQWARREGLKSLDEETLPQKTVLNGEGKPVLDQSYYNMVNEIRTALPAIIEFAVRNIDFERYQPVTIGKLFGLNSYLVACDECKGEGHGNYEDTGAGYDCRACDTTGMDNKKVHTPIIEWEFQYGSFKGIVDAVLLDTWTNEYVVVDWKLRYMFQSDDVAALDGQLAFYAALLNSMGARITKAVMWQFRRSVPQPAKLNQNGMPSVAAQTTTFDYWWDTLPSDLQGKLKRDEWAKTLEGKVKDISYFVNPVSTPVTEGSSKTALDNAYLVLNAIQNASIKNSQGIPAPALLGGQTCQFCDFFRLCSGAFKYGGDATLLIQLEYRPRRTEEVEEIEVD
jgi:hypothetical protein